MIQFNLLPDVKLQYIKAQRTKRLVMVISLVAAALSIALVTVLFLTVQVAQKKHLKDLSSDIVDQTKKLNSVEDLNKILTIQNQLNSLTTLHQSKPVTSRLFGFIQQVTPVQASISKLDIDFSVNTLTIVGTVDTLLTANQFSDTLKFATYKTAATDKGKPFSNVVTTLGLGDKKSTYVLTMSFDPVLFLSAEVPVLTVPAITSTRSETEKPATLFKEAPAPVPTKTGGN